MKAEEKERFLRVEEDNIGGGALDRADYWDEDAETCTLW